MRTSFWKTLAIGLPIIFASVSGAFAQSLPHEIVAGEPVSAKGLNDNFRFLLDRIEQLEIELGEARARLENKVESSAIPDFSGFVRLSDLEALFWRDKFRGAVIAFDRSEKENACPEGWREFEPAAGRFVIGAGIHRNEDAAGNLLDVYPSFADDTSAATGGAKGFVSKGEGQPITVWPPFVALYYCRFDG